MGRVSTAGSVLAPVLLLACAGCSKDAGTDTGTSTGTSTETSATYADPSLPGPWPAGTDVQTITGSSGVSLDVQAWFPRTDDSGSLHAYGGLIEGGAWDGGTADCAQPRPVLVFSHGNGGMRWQSFFLTEHLASHGWIVVAPDHTYNTFFDEDSSMQSELIFRRPVDIADTFDALLARSADPEDRLYGCVDPDAGYAIAGHSFGGFTTLAIAGAIIDTDAVASWCSDYGGWLCDEVAEYAAAHPDQTVYDLSDSRAWAAVAMAPAAYETLRTGLPLIDIPTLILGGSLDTLTPWYSVVQPIWQDLSVDPRAAGLIEGAGHFSFSDACLLLPSYDDCNPPFLDPAEVHGIVNTVTLAWIQSAAGEARADDWLPPDDDRLGWTTP